MGCASARAVLRSRIKLSLRVVRVQLQQQTLSIKYVQLSKCRENWLFID